MSKESVINSLCLLGAGAALQYIVTSKFDLDVSATAMKIVKQGMKLGTKALDQVKLVNKAEMSPMKWLRSPEVIENIIYIVGTGTIMYSKGLSFGRKASLANKAGAISESFFDSSKTVLCCYKVINIIRKFVERRELPVKELFVAGSMVIASRVAKWYF
jgi:hypothetical protein